MLYGTTAKFMEYFGINEITELPVPKDFTGEMNIIGENSDLKEPDAQA
jgi:segregation and condensation protein B